MTSADIVKVSAALTRSALPSAVQTRRSDRRPAPRRPSRKCLSRVAPGCRELELADRDASQALS